MYTVVTLKTILLGTYLIVCCNGVYSCHTGNNSTLHLPNSLLEVVPHGMKTVRPNVELGKSAAAVSLMIITENVYRSYFGVKRGLNI